jgi:DNA-binding MarR family transcriptional regulator
LAEKAGACPLRAPPPSPAEARSTGADGIANPAVRQNVLRRGDPMSLQSDLGLPNPIANHGHEAVLNVVLTAALLSKEGDRILRPFGITDSQFNVLMLLRHQAPDGEINQTQLGRMLLVNRSNVTGLIDRMEQAGWVQRRADASDRRVKMVALTEEGRKLVGRAEKIYFERLETLWREISDSAIQQLCRTLEKVRRPLRDMRGDNRE